MNDRSKAQILWKLTEGYRLTFAIAIGSMAIGYVFMFGVPLVAKFSIDAILAPEVIAPPWLFTLASFLSFEEKPGMLAQGKSQPQAAKLTPRKQQRRRGTVSIDE